METFPAYFPLRGKRVIIAGEGESAEAKARLFEGSPAEVVRLTGAAACDPAAYAGATLIFVASFDADFCRSAARAARGAGVPLNVVDHPELSDFHTPAIVDRGQVVAAVGTAGASPLFASLLRAEVEARIPEGAGRIAALLGGRREAVRRTFPDLADRRAFLRAALAGPATAAAAAGDEVRASALLDEAIASGGRLPGQVSVIETAAAHDLMSLRAARVLASVDVVVSGDDALALLANHTRRDAERLAPDATDVEALADLVRSGRWVAIVGAAATPSLIAALGALGIAVETLSSARAS